LAAPWNRRPSCCGQQAGVPAAVPVSQRSLALAQPAAHPVQVGLLSAFHSHVSFGLFNPALEKRDRLAPFLTDLSISRT
jgi:hypothetical protein